MIGKWKVIIFIARLLKVNEIGTDVIDQQLDDFFVIHFTVTTCY